jgi:hypothetical protein
LSHLRFLLSARSFEAGVDADIAKAKRVTQFRYLGGPITIDAPLDISAPGQGFSLPTR